MHQSGLFEGDRMKYLSYDISFLTDGKYRVAGQLVAMSMAQEDSACIQQCMTPFVTSKLLSRSTLTTNSQAR